MGGRRADRLARQRDRSRENRRQKKEAKIPGRDDVARVALRWLLKGAVLFGDAQKLLFLEDALIGELKRLGFDERASGDVLEDLIEKYGTDAWDFFPKVHLRTERPE